jgi:catechol 2,3-dioxygenase-like lactoylglutathione lyase family enzyme
MRSTRWTPGSSTANYGSVTAVRLDHVTIAVSDWTRSIEFYRTVISAEVIDRGLVPDPLLGRLGRGYPGHQGVALLGVRPANSPSTI